MTNTTRELTFRSAMGATLLRANTHVPNTPGDLRYALSVTTVAGDIPTWSHLTPDQVEELHELTGLILKGRDRVIDARIVCGAYLEAVGESPRVECCLDGEHGPINGDGYTHITSSGTLFNLSEF